jgi:lipoprotein-anchoring transpeptidase ErfK/SrfK
MPFVGRRLAAGVGVVALGLSACGGGDSPSAAPASITEPPPSVTTPASTTVVPATTTAPAKGAVLAVASVARVDVYISPVQPEPARSLENPQPSGAAPGTTYPLRMLVTEDRGDWLKVLLPVRPNGSTGWVRREAVTLEPPHPFRVKVELGEHRITVWEGERVVLQEAVGIGASGRTPTTQGLFFTTEVFDVLPSQRSAYGPYAFALSGFSEVLYSFGGGTGVLGIHGTDDTSSLGRDVSNGCIRMSNSGITKLYELLPLGTPVEITV